MTNQSFTVTRLLVAGGELVTQHPDYATALDAYLDTKIDKTVRFASLQDANGIGVRCGPAGGAPRRNV